VASKRLILASASPRRRELLSRLVRSFDVIPSGAPEVHSPELAPDQAAAGVALAKALTVLHEHPDAVVLGADTVVHRTGGDGFVLYGKPADREDAKRMLAELSGAMHFVSTGIAVVWHGRAGELRGRIEAVTTGVWFRPLTAPEIAAYVATGEPLDKAGAYGIQEGAAAFVERIEGDYFNVVGLSLAAVRRLLRGLLPDLGPVPPLPHLPFRVSKLSPRA